MNPAVMARSGEILSRIPKGGTVVELGVWDGRLSVEILKRSDATLYMVDTWAPVAKRPESYIETGDVRARSTDDEMEQAMGRAHAIASVYPGRAIISRTDTANEASAHEDGSVDLVFVDADHSEEGCRRDIEAWLPKVKPGGWIGGHDYNHPVTPGVAIAVELVFGKPPMLGLDRTWWMPV